ncbi:hypothetical protein F5888DRAFT_1387107 [Russula emetica]|nr:hypothetical protein F5888DRAFT_1387107 [Russula emetica]
MVAYCATTLQGATCVNSRCAYNHDVFHCEPCRRSFPASLLVQHQSAQLHLRNVAANGSPVPSTPRSPPLSQSTFSDLLSAPTANTYRPPGRNTPAPDVDPRVTVSDEGGLYFVVDGTGSADNPSFPSTSRTIVIERTDVISSLTVRSMKLTPSPSPCFVARLLGKTLDVRKGSPRKIEVSFEAPRDGIFRGTLMITFRDKTERDEEFTVTRELRGCGILPGAASSPEPSNKAEGDGAESERAGVTVSHDLGVEFSVERSRLDEPFDKLTKELVITKTSAIPLVSFKEARVNSLDKSVARMVFRAVRRRFSVDQV